MPQTSAGLLMYRLRPQGMQVLLVHPGGPFWKHKDLGAWTIPKGRIEPGEEALAAAQREFREETSFPPVPPFLQLTPIRQRSGKIVHAWAFEGDCDPAAAHSNTCTMEWPPKSGRLITVPEIDRAEFFDLATARQKINPAQSALLDELTTLLTPQP